MSTPLTERVRYPRLQLRLQRLLLLARSPICVSDESRLALPSSAMSDAAEAAFDLGEYFKDPLSSLYNGLDMAACAYPAREWLYDVHITPH